MRDHGARPGLRRHRESPRAGHPPAPRRPGHDHVARRRPVRGFQPVPGGRRGCPSGRLRLGLRPRVPGADHPEPHGRPRRRHRPRALCPRHRRLHAHPHLVHRQEHRRNPDRDPGRPGPHGAGRPPRLRLAASGGIPARGSARANHAPQCPQHVERALSHRQSRARVRNGFGAFLLGRRQLRYGGAPPGPDPGAGNQLGLRELRHPARHLRPEARSGRRLPDIPAQARFSTASG